MIYDIFVGFMLATIFIALLVGINLAMSSARKRGQR